MASGFIRISLEIIVLSPISKEVIWEGALLHLRSRERRFYRCHEELNMCPLWLREHSGPVSDDYMVNLKGRDQPARCSDHRSVEEVSVG